jgi:(p)ppGpp synthase/HD superfamily hydrolase
MHALIDAALAFAATAHQGQKRKGSAVPYIVHPVGVMLLLLQAGETDPEVLAAALLHDTVEDVGVTRAELRERFGERVAAIVEGCSEPDKRLSWEARKQHTVAYLQTAPRAVQLVAVADKLNNLHSLMADYAEIGEALWKRFKRGRAETAWYYHAVLDSLKVGGLGDHPLWQELERGTAQFFDAPPAAGGAVPGRVTRGVVSSGAGSK